MSLVSWIRTALAAIALIGMAAGAPSVAAASAPIATSGGAPVLRVADQPDANLIDPALWEAYKTHFISPEGRLADDANGNISHTEGQGYAMLLSVFAGDDLGFSRIWGWTVRELYRRGDGLGSWKWDPATTPHLSDTNNASDGDLLIAWALAEAAKRWKSPEYKAAAHTIAVSVFRHSTFTSPYGLTLYPGASGFGPKDMADGPVINLSYWVFPAFVALKPMVPEVDWDGLTKSGLDLLKAGAFPPAQLPPDWISLKSGQPTPSTSFPPTFGYNAIRIPLYLIWGGQANSGALAPFAAAWRDAATPSVVNVASGQATEPFYDQGYAALAALTTCTAFGTPIPTPLKAVKIERYYSTTLHLLSLVAARQRSLSCE